MTRGAHFYYLSALILFCRDPGVRAQAVPGDAPAASTGTLGLSTRYVSRGLDLSEGGPVPQAGLEFAGPSGVYVDGYAAKIRYFGMNAEIDSTIGYRSNRGRLHYDVGVYYYYYPGAGLALHASYAELGAKLLWGSGPVTPVLEVYVSNNYFFGAGKSIFVWSGADVSFPAGISAGARFGYVAVEHNGPFIYPDYSTWQLSAGKDLFGINWSLQLTDTSLTRRDCTDGSRCAVKLTVRVAKSF